MCVCEGGVHIGVLAELLMRHVQGERVTSSSKSLPFLSKTARLPLSLTLPLKDLKEEQEIRRRR